MNFGAVTGELERIASGEARNLLRHMKILVQGTMVANIRKIKTEEEKNGKFRKIF